MPSPLSITITQDDPGAADAIVLYADAQGPLGQKGRALFRRTGLDFARLADATGFAGRPGHMIDIPAPAGIDAKRLLVLGRGADGETDTDAAWADRGGSLAAKLEAADAVTASVVIDEKDAAPGRIAALAAGARLRAYRFETHQAKRNGKSEPLQSLTLALASTRGVDEALAEAMAVAESTILARDLVNAPSNLLGPDEMVAAGRDLAPLGVEIDVLGPGEMAELGMGAILAVGRGSARPPRMLVLQWRGGKSGQAPVAIVGKGIVFDTGGISIKGAASMENMKGDMGGAAAALATIRCLAARKARVNAVAVLALAENMPDGDAYRPGDILTAMSGKTIEVVNTDAEGRIALADALWYAQDRFAPVAMFDLATLTGAIIVALGHDHAGVFTNTPELAEKLQAAGLSTGEKVWPLPMGPAYEKLIESRFADIRNSAGRNGSSIAAAHFLAHFVNAVPWAHIDIAGTAFGAPSTETNTSWASGFGVALLDRLIRDNYER